ncbi:MAG: NADH-quinone oxidoreductase subunit J [Armatimonadetes bacterium]|nr:NADH-quinone oxidoreductase subunit J [Armatimonadota bacterium]NIO75066.1 NADH-quinone oxidoreductase subunit J [Armatimonadota bacterium]NIO95716.1 NADH-quinone oxidoreductase subunit J [Armatimonadota bacterium]
MGELITFLALAFITVVPAVMVVGSRNVFHAGLWLIPTLIGVAGFYLTLGAEFVAAIQVLIYVGGIMVLLLFAILLTRRIGDPEARLHNRMQWWALLFALVIGVILHLSIRGQFGAIYAAAVPPEGTTAKMGEALLGPYLLPFEIASIVLLAAIIGAIVLARGERQ